MRINMILTIALLSLTKLSWADTNKDVSFFVLGKSPLYWQDQQGKILHTNHYLFGEIFLKAGGNIKKGTLHLPKASRYKSMPFSEAGHVWKIKRQDLENRQALDKAFPDGQYRFEFETQAGEKYERTVSLNLPEGKHEFTAPVTIYFYQKDTLVAQSSIDPNHDLLIRWSPFNKGQQDSEGIADDLVFAIGSDCQGNAFARSALPFEDIPALTFNDHEFRIPADRIDPGSEYNFLVEHAELVDTQGDESGIIGLAAFATVTKTIFKTTGPKNTNCPSK